MNSNYLGYLLLSLLAFSVLACSSPGTDEQQSHAYRGQRSEHRADKHQHWRSFQSCYEKNSDKYGLLSTEAVNAFCAKAWSKDVISPLAGKFLERLTHLDILRCFTFYNYSPATVITEVLLEANRTSGEVAQESVYLWLEPLKWGEGCIPNYDDIDWDSVSIKGTQGFELFHLETR